MKHVSEMTSEEQAAALAELKRGPKPLPEPLPMDKRAAKDMTERERQEWLAEHKRRMRI